jgi:hypothetical protein
MVKDLMAMSERGELMNEEDGIDLKQHKEKIFKRLDWNLNGEVKTAILKAASAMDK